MKAPWEMNLAEMLEAQKKLMDELRDQVGASVYARIEKLAELSEAIGESE